MSASISYKMILAIDIDAGNRIGLDCSTSMVGWQISSLPLSGMVKDSCECIYFILAVVLKMSRSRIDDHVLNCEVDCAPRYRGS